MKGETVFELPKTAGNPRNSEGAFLSLSADEIIFVYSRFVGKTGLDHDDSELYLIRSADGGHTWDKGRTILTKGEEQAMNIMSVSLLSMKDGSIGLFYLVRKSLTLIRMYLRRSYDGGRNWTDRKPCFTRQGVFVVNNDRVTRLSDGRIIIPAAYHHSGFLTESDEDPNKGYVETHADTVFFLSDDDGDTFRMTHKCLLPYHGTENAGLQEPGLVELKNDALWAWARTDLGRQYEMYSVYRGERWTTPQPSRFTSPCSPLSMKRTPTGDLLAVWNPIPKWNGQGRLPHGYPTAGRVPLAAAISHDDGLTFSHPLPIETDIKSGFCYTAIHFHGDAVYLAYSFDDLTGLRCRRYSLNELTAACDQAKEDQY